MKPPRQPRPFATIQSDDLPEAWLRKVLLQLDRETAVHSRPDFFRRAQQRKEALDPEKPRR